VGRVLARQVGHDSRNRVKERPVADGSNGPWLKPASSPRLVLGPRWGTSKNRDLPGGKNGSGILRAKPNIRWRKDRGKVHFPWFWKNGKFTAERVNDVHLTNGERRAAREAARLAATRT